MLLLWTCYADPAHTGVDFDADGYAAGDDCDDLSASVHPGAAEVPYTGVDEDCNPRTADDDLDGDGYLVADDCDDSDPGVNPAADEICNGRDDDCDNLSDEEDPGLIDAVSWYEDVDGDGFGDPADVVVSCGEAGTRVRDGSDCNDGEPAIHPGAEETCDDRDEDCDGVVDEDVCAGDTGDTGDTGWDSGFSDSGLWDTGDTAWDSGFWDSGFWDSGFWDSGFWDSGFWDSGFWDSGRHTGDSG